MTRRRRHTRTRACALALSLALSLSLGLAACGKYGPPKRRPPDRPAPETETEPSEKKRSGAIAPEKRYTLQATTGARS